MENDHAFVENSGGALRLEDYFDYFTNQNVDAENNSVNSEYDIVLFSINENKLIDLLEAIKHDPNRNYDFDYNFCYNNNKRVFNLHINNAIFPVVFQDENHINFLKPQKDIRGKIKKFKSKQLEGFSLDMRRVNQRQLLAYLSKYINISMDRERSLINLRHNQRNNTRRHG